MGVFYIDGARDRGAIGRIGNDVRTKSSFGMSVYIGDTGSQIRLAHRK